jgi:hypothetical protein
VTNATVTLLALGADMTTMMMMMTAIPFYLFLWCKTKEQMRFYKPVYTLSHIYSNVIGGSIHDASLLLTTIPTANFD